MKHLFLTISLAIALAIPTMLTPAPVDAAKCVGADPCRACKTCSSCKHCAKLGGECGVCR